MKIAKKAAELTNQLDEIDREKINKVNLVLEIINSPGFMEKLNFEIEKIEEEKS